MSFHCIHNILVDNEDDILTNGLAISMLINYSPPLRQFVPAKRIQPDVRLLVQATRALIPELEQNQDNLKYNISKTNYITLT